MATGAGERLGEDNVAPTKETPDGVTKGLKESRVVSVLREGVTLADEAIDS